MCLFLDTGDLAGFVERKGKRLVNIVLFFLLSIAFSFPLQILLQIKDQSTIFHPCWSPFRGEPSILLYEISLLFIVPKGFELITQN